MDMFRYIRSKIPASAHGGARQKDAEFFRFQKTLQHGFPSKASCIAYDARLKLMAIGTKNGQIRIYGAPGVEFTGQHGGGKSVQRLLFLNGQGRLVSFCEDQTFHLWEINFRDGKGYLDHLLECSASGKMKRISCCGLKMDANGDASILVGTESGNVYALDIRTFQLTDHVIYQDAVIQNIPDDYKLSPGAVEALAVHPRDPNKLLIGYNRGLVVLWDSSVGTATQTFVAPQQVDSLAWLRRGEKFISSHNDGSYIVWSSNNGNQAALSKPDAASTMPFGPFPCKPIDKILFKTTDDPEDDYVIWTGGMPRASYGDRHVVAVQRKTKQVVFDFNTRVVDFLTVDNPIDIGDNYDEADCPKALLVLCEEELVAIDLESPAWPTFQLPYLQPLHASPITACLHVTDVNREAFYEKLVKFGTDQAKDAHYSSEHPWPINGGENTFQSKHPTDLLITGHEDGSVKFWSSGGSSMSLLYTLQTAKVFDGYMDPSEQPAAEEDWPPFRKVGVYDPYSDDPRFGVQRLAFDAQEGVLLVAGAAGQATVWSLNDDKVDIKLQVITADLTSEAENFVWKGKERLQLRENGKFTFTPGFVPSAVLQMNPPASATSVALQSSWGVVAVGTAHGFALFDYKIGKATFKKCLLTPAELISGVASAGEGTMSRFKSFKKSLRESFRRKRGPRSPKSASPEPPKMTEDEGQAASSTAGGSEQAAAGSPPTPGEKKEATAAAASPKKVSPSPIPVEGSPIRPIEREVKERTETNALNSMVRTMYFCQTYLLNASNTVPTLWVGTNGGTIVAMTLTVPETAEKREEMGGVQCQLAKEVHLRHHAPVLALTVVDGQGFPLDNPRPVVVVVAAATAAASPPAEASPSSAPPAPAPAATTAASTATSPGSVHDHGHRLIVCSEEQIKSFHLYMLKPSRYKFKLTATEGARIRKVQFVNLQSKSDENKWESFIVIMTNQGDVHTFDTHHFRRYLTANCVQSSDINGILSTVLTRRGDGFYLVSSSEWQRFSVNARYAVSHAFSLEIPEGARPQLAAAQPQETAVAEGVQEMKLEEKQVDEQQQRGAGGTSAALAAGAAETSVLSGGDEPPSLNSSALPSDLTIDSIRDYTTHTASTESHVTDKGTVTITEKVTKTVHTITGGGGTTVTHEKKMEENIVNGSGGNEVDDMSLAKTKVVTSSNSTSSTHETKTISSSHFTASQTATAE